MSKTPTQVYQDHAPLPMWDVDEPALNAVAAHARREALEEAAKVCEDEICSCCWDADAEAAATHLAECIRALLNASPGSGGQPSGGRILTSPLLLDGADPVSGGTMPAGAAPFNAAPTEEK